MEAYLEPASARSYFATVISRKYEKLLWKRKMLCLGRCWADVGLGFGGLTLFPRNWRGSVQKESRVRKRRDRSTSWNSSISGLMSS